MKTHCDAAAVLAKVGVMKVHSRPPHRPSPHSTRANTDVRHHGKGVLIRDGRIELASSSATRSPVGSGARRQGNPQCAARSTFRLGMARCSTARHGAVRELRVASQSGSPCLVRTAQTRMTCDRCVKCVAVAVPDRASGTRTAQRPLRTPRAARLAR